MLISRAWQRSDVHCSTSFLLLIVDLWLCFLLLGLSTFLVSYVVADALRKRRERAEALGRGEPGGDGDVVRVEERPRAGVPRAVAALDGPDPRDDAAKVRVPLQQPAAEIKKQE